MMANTPRKKQPAPKQPDSNQQILSVLQDLFILEALRSGMKVEDVRRTLHVDQWRVASISKALKEPKSRPTK